MKPLVFLSALIFSAFSFAGTYKYVDEDGVTHYGDSIPAEHLNRGSEELNRRGIVIKKTEPALTPAQRKAIADERESRVQEEKKATQQKRLDDALLMTYTSVAEINAKQERELQQTAHAISNLEAQHKSANLRLQEQLKLKTAAKTGIPEHLASDIARSGQRIAYLGEQLSLKRFELTAIEAKYEGYKKRFAELKGESSDQAIAR